MKFKFIFSLLLCCTALTAMSLKRTAADQKLFPKLITKSEKIHPGVYLIPDSHDGNENSGASGAACTIGRDNIVVDFSGVTLRGSRATAAPDMRRGVGVLITGRNVTIRNLHVQGYKTALLARNAPGIKIVGGDYSENWKQRLASTPVQEDLSDWMSFHQNEKGEWLRYGAAIYLDHCDNFTVSHATAVGGQCGLMLNRSSHGTVSGCNFSFLSGVGIGLYRSSDNRIQQNKIDWCVRGYSHGVYNRGQDSAGILVYEQSCRNVFAYNSVTHGGDGFFLWAGQSTMDTGKGGCNDNLVYGNDFSHAPTNGIETTFSRNTFANNKIYECWHGVWGGYSYDSKFIGNRFGYNAESIAIEHGQHNLITGNTFFHDNAGIRLWENATQDPNWGYPKFHDTKSHDYTITGNHFNSMSGNITAFTRTDKVVFIDADPIVKKYTEAFMQPNGEPILSTERDDHAYRARFSTPDWNPFSKETGGIAAPKLIPGCANPFLSPKALRGQKYIIVDEWGPYDFHHPLLTVSDPFIMDGKSHDWSILGPAGSWKLKNASSGIKLSRKKGGVPGDISIQFPVIGSKVSDVKIELEYIRGGRRVEFGMSRFIAPIHWNISFFSWDRDKSDPRTNSEAFQMRLKDEPLARTETEKLDFAGNGRFAKNVPSDYFAAVAEGVFEAPPGRYILDFTTDDGCRASLDGKPILIDAWKYQGPTLYSVPVRFTSTTKHNLHIEYFQIDGYAQLKVNLRRRNQ